MRCRNGHEWCSSESFTQQTDVFGFIQNAMPKHCRCYLCAKIYLKFEFQSNDQRENDRQANILLQTIQEKKNNYIQLSKWTNRAIDDATNSNTLSFSLSIFASFSLFLSFLQTFMANINHFSATIRSFGILLCALHLHFTHFHVQLFNRFLFFTLNCSKKRLQ